MASSSRGKKTKRPFWDRFKGKGSRSTAISEIGANDTTSHPPSPSNAPEEDNAIPLPIQSNAASEEDLGMPAHSLLHPDTKEGLGIAGRFVQTLLKKLPGCIDGNPVKMAFSIVKTIIEVKDEIGDNKDLLTERLQRTKLLLSDAIGKVELDDSEDVKREIKDYKRNIQEQNAQLVRITQELESIVRNIDYENYKKRINTICTAIDETTNVFMLHMQIEIRKTTAKMHEQMKEEKMAREAEKQARQEEQQERRMLSLQGLNPSRKADHRTVLEGQSLKRETCAEGTRVKILEGITNWANDHTINSPRVFWLTGQAGSGKTTIAYTIAKRFESGQPTILGASFLCSRHFDETRSLNPILPTIAYQLSYKCESYVSALHAQLTDKSAVVDHDISEQIQELFVGPWLDPLRHRDPATYLVIVDALDEIDESGGSKFLDLLLTTINQQHFIGLKFLVASRTDPRIVEICDSFESRAVYRLQDVPIEDANVDIERYLDLKLPRIVGSPEITELRHRASGLFIYAATVVRILTSSQSITYKEQMRRLNNFLSKPSGMSGKNKSPIDELYQQILCAAFSDFMDEEDLNPRLRILFTFLCTFERISTSVAAGLMDDDDELAKAVVNDLHAVLYIQDGRVFWYHASFLDFLFSQHRSNFHVGNEEYNFWCDEVAHRNLLATSCLRVMNSDGCGLRFNMGDIRTSYLLDSENVEEISEQVNKNIRPVLRYSLFHWVAHLSYPPPSFDDARNILSRMLQFLQIRVLFWIEAMNLLGSVRECTPMLHKAQVWVHYCMSELKLKWKEFDFVYSSLLEAANFSTYFGGSPAGKSTPHLYISSLATWKPEFAWAQQWKNQFCLIPTFTHNGGTNVPLLTIQIPSGMAIYAVTFSMNGTQIASGSTDCFVRIWDASSGEELKILKGHNGVVNSVSFTSDNRWIASGSGDRSVRVWDVWNGEIAKIMEGHTGAVNSVSFSRSGSWVVSSSDDTSIRVWDVSTSGVLRVLEGHAGWVNSVAFSDDDTRIVSGSADRSVRLWDAITGEILRVMKGHTDDVGSAAISSDGAWIVSGSKDRSVRVWDASTGELLRVMAGHSDYVGSVALSGNSIVSSSNDNTVRVWVASTGDVLGVLKGHTQNVSTAGFSSDGARIVSGSLDGSMRVWNSATFPVAELNHSVNASVDSMFAFSTDGTRIMSHSFGSPVRVWDTFTGHKFQVPNNRSEPITSVAISRDGTHVAWGSEDGHVHISDVTSKHPEAKVFKLKASSGGNAVLSIALSNDGTMIACSSQRDYTVQLWDVLTGDELRVLNGHTNWVLTVAFSGDAKQIVSGSYDQSVRIWDVSDPEGENSKVMEGHSNWVLSVAFSSDATRIISGSVDESVRVWDALTGTMIMVLNGHTRWVRAVAFSNDGKLAVSGSDDHTVAVWNVSDDSGATPIKVLTGRHNDSVNSVALSDDGSSILSGSWDGSVLIWGMDDPLWYVSEGNWIRSSSTNDRLMWVPPEANVLQRPNCLVISGNYSSVDFEQSMIGPNWWKCYTPELLDYRATSSPCYEA
ncbi:hypothetical protein CVT25_010017 [Psilocybe cyanescens]|uniref:NACHT domain-containing protein n=1 Tax=Psilocybe cyanescens TaxID=93625 RepID=A0A409X3C4_PSICY|nr:hypothetical protein CVT25_010017 [Psilocybe cyanescens]